MLIQVIAAFIAVIAIAITFGVPKKFLFHSGLVGSCGWLAYLVFRNIGISVVSSMFFATLIVSLISHSFARILKTPVTLFLIAGILPLVPGVGMYRMVYNLIIGENGLAMFYFSETMQIAGMIAVAIFIMDTIFRAFQKS